MPALKNPPAPVRMPVVSASSSSSWSKAAAIARAVAWSMLLRARGRLIVTTSVVPSRSTRTRGSSVPVGVVIAGASGSRRRDGSSRR
jgi:hypothetical protein